MGGASFSRENPRIEIACLLVLVDVGVNANIERVLASQALG